MELSHILLLLYVVRVLLVKKLMFLIMKGTPAAFSVNVDYWLLVMSNIFIPNPVSTVSLNVVRKRKTMDAQHKRVHLVYPIFDYPELYRTNWGNETYKGPPPTPGEITPDMCGVSMPQQKL
jgi:hypothetical protein